nr:unnamed protein product [Callosobruchus chinensis]
MSNRPISVVELERRRLATAASLSKDLEAITAWGLKNMVEFNAYNTQYSAGKKLGYLLRARKYFSPSNLLTLYKAQVRPSLEYCSHILGTAAPTTLAILDAVQRRAIRLIGDPALTCHLQPLSHRRAVGNLSLFYRYSDGFCSSEQTAIMPPLSKPARCTRGTSSSHHKAVVLYTSRTELYDRTFVPRMSRAWHGLPDAGAALRSRGYRVRCGEREMPHLLELLISTLELVQANKPDIVLLDHRQKTMIIIEFSAPAELNIVSRRSKSGPNISKQALPAKRRLCSVLSSRHLNIVSKEEEKRNRYQELLGQLRRLWPDYAVSLLVMVIGSLGGMRNTLLSALHSMPVCRVVAHILAARMQKAVILGSLRLLRAHLTVCF